MWLALATVGGLGLLWLRDRHRFQRLASGLLKAVELPEPRWASIDDLAEVCGEDVEALKRHRTGLEAEGFVMLADVEDSALRARQADYRLLIRLMISEDGRVYAAILQHCVRRQSAWQPHGPPEIQLVSELDQGTLVYTVLAPPRRELFHPPEMHLDFRGFTAELGAEVRHHRSRSERLATRTFSTLEEVRQSQARETALVNDQRWKAVAGGLSRSQLMALGGPSTPVLGRRVASEMADLVRSPEAF